MTGASLKVSCSGADEDFIFSDNPLTASPAYAAVGVHDNGPGFHENVDQPLLQSL